MSDFSNDGPLIWTLKAVFILLFLLTSVLIAIWFERKIVGRVQVRPGPNWHGPFGLLQSLGDAMKLLFKEDMTVKAADKVMYLLAPMIAVFASLLTFAVIPMGPEVKIPFTDVVTPLQLTDFSVATLYILACASIGIYGIVLGGWSSGSTYPLLGAVRSTAQMISYELAMGLALVAVFIKSGSMSTGEIVEAQSGGWWAFFLFPAFIIYIIAMVGETNRLPFDLPEAEGELVSGYMTEYSSMKFAWFFLAEYINMLNVSAVATTLFLGGWRAPFGLGQINDGMFNEGWWPVLWFLMKVWGIMFFFVVVRGTLIRFRYDQFMKLGWKILIPFALGYVILVALIEWSNEEYSQRTTYIWIAVAAAVLVVLFLFYGSIKDQIAKKKALTSDSKPKKEQPFDAFADGFPVPPMPGQKLPPSPRSKAKAAAAASADNKKSKATSVITAEAKEGKND